MRIDPDNFAPDQREKFDEDIIRIGLRREFSPRSDLIASYWNRESRTDLSFGENSRVGAELEGDQFEAQYLHRFGKGNLRTGVSYFSGDRIDTDMTTGELFTSREEETDYGAYAYSTIDISNRLSVTLGLSAQSTEGGLVDTDQVNPKVGMAYRFGRDGSTTLRAAAFRTRQRTIASDQTLEPTTIAGFNQFFDDAEGADAVRYGIGIDRAFGETWFAGAEVSRRDIEVTGGTWPDGSPWSPRATWMNDSRRHTSTGSRRARVAAGRGRSARSCRGRNSTDPTDSPALRRSCISRRINWKSAPTCFMAPVSARERQPRWLIRTEHSESGRRSVSTRTTGTGSGP
ncbi:MAG: TonB-dependent receptor [Gammaproteobacteria bacterium]|nr:TonB-dependent receptor [Gammaproteobacteria bacterium]